MRGPPVLLQNRSWKSSPQARDRNSTAIWGCGEMLRDRFRRGNQNTEGELRGDVGACLTFCGMGLEAVGTRNRMVAKRMGEHAPGAYAQSRMHGDPTGKSGKRVRPSSAHWWPLRLPPPGPPSPPTPTGCKRREGFCARNGCSRPRRGLYVDWMWLTQRWSFEDRSLRCRMSRPRRLVPNAVCSQAIVLGIRS